MTKRRIKNPHHTTQVNTSPKLNPGCLMPNVTERVATIKKRVTGTKKRNWKEWSFTRRLMRPISIRSVVSFCPHFIWPCVFL
jgi:hypothetical protein